jgi:hypothetical protein
VVSKGPNFKKVAHAGEQTRDLLVFSFIFKYYRLSYIGFPGMAITYSLKMFMSLVSGVNAIA